MAKKKEVEKPNLGGRPTKYKDEYDKQAFKLCLLGATDEELANFFEVNVDSIHEWKKVHPNFSDSIKAGKQEADANVANRLYQRALGYEHDTEEIKVVNVGDFQQEVMRIPVKKIYPPDATSAIFWLKNRQPKKWRDKQDHDHTTNGEKITSIIITDIDGAKI